MALTKNVNYGFVAVAPVDDPAGANSGGNGYSCGLKVTCPTSAALVTEIGWWCDSNTTETGNDLGLYSHDSGNDMPQDLLGHVNQALGTVAGWKRATGLSISVTPGTTYWIGIQADAGQTINYNYAGDVGEIFSYKDGSQTALPTDYGTETGHADDFPVAYYCLYTAGGGAVNTKSWINVSDVWQTIKYEWINISDVWRPITHKWINVSDVWRVIY